MTTRRAAIADLPDWPRGMSLGEAARYVGVSPLTFLKFVKVPPRSLGARKIWDRAAIDAWFDSGAASTEHGGASPTMEEAAARWGKSQ